MNDIFTQEELDRLIELNARIYFSQQEIIGIFNNAEQRLENLIYFCNNGKFPNEKIYNQLLTLFGE